MDFMKDGEGDNWGSATFTFQKPQNSFSVHCDMFVLPMEAVVSAGTGGTGASTPCQDAAASGGEVHRREALHRCVNFISLYLALSPVNHLSSPMGWQDAVTLHRQ